MNIKAHFKDLKHDLDVDIICSKSEYSYYNFIMKLDGILFQAAELDDFELVYEKDYEKAKEKFLLLTYEDEVLETGYYYRLQRYSIKLEIPTLVIEQQTNEEKAAKIKLEYELAENTKKTALESFFLNGKRVFQDKTICNRFELVIGEENYSTSGEDISFNDLLIKIGQKIKNKYWFKNCFGCIYSDYASEGYFYFGAMRCYQGKIEQYCKKQKIKLSDLLYSNSGKILDYIESEKDYKVKQETECCEYFKKRIGNCGFREAIY